MLKQVARIMVVALALVSVGRLLMVPIRGGLQTRWAELTVAGGRASAINGYRIDFSTVAERIGGFGDDGALRYPTVVFVMSDVCPACADEMPVWLAFLKANTLPPGTRISLVTMSGTKFLTELSDAASSVRLPVSAWAVGQAEIQAFVTYTGLGSVPAVLLLDGNSRVRFVASTLGREGPNMILETVSRLKTSG